MAQHMPDEQDICRRRALNMQRTMHHTMHHTVQHTMQATMTTPARRQYLEIKARHQDAILFYQVGDFYETFDGDAVIASRELQIVLTGRSYGPSEHVPLAGVPLHALETYAARLVARGYTVAICDQVSPPGKGLVKREVTRVLTPGTVVEPTMLSARRDTYLAAISFRYSRSGQLTGVGLAYVDASTGAFWCTAWDGAAHDDARAELHRLGPTEILIPQRSRMTAEGPPEAEWVAVDGATVTPCPAHYFDTEDAHYHLCQHFSTPSLAAYGCESQPLATAAAGAVLAYLERTNTSLLRLVTGLRTYDARGYVEIDGRTWRALQVVEPARAGGSPTRDASSATLLSVLDTTRTAMGARALRRTLLHPLTDRAALEERLDAVEELVGSPALREQLAAALDGMHDLERLTGRVVQGAATARELHGLRIGLSGVPDVALGMTSCTATGLVSVCSALDACLEVQAIIERAVTDPATNDGYLIRAGYDGRRDTLVGSIADARRWIALLEASERRRTGIKSLKVGYNQVFGYYIEVTRPNLGLVPTDYQRRQTLAHAERFVTPDLKEHEAVVLHAEEQIAVLERVLYAQVLAEVAQAHARLRSTALAVAQLDVWLSLATVAVAREYVRPQLTDATELEITGGRHPIVEATLGGDFIPNDTALAPADAPDGTRIMLLTGPNMAGKSTYLRQVAAIVVLAQIGSFVPARSARIGLVDRIFSRVGADDDLARGISTFMLEMLETAYILRHATPRSLVILDEVGRGTSTRDGLAIARAVVEHLHSQTHARTLFASHYHELAALAADLPGLGTYQLDVLQRGDEAVFLHRVVPGTSDHSYGVQVARMAGLPSTVTQRAAALLNEDDAHLTRVAEGGQRYHPEGGQRYHPEGGQRYHAEPEGATLPTAAAPELNSVKPQEREVAPSGSA
jgi:DNA mismatch repair protein MutS